VRREPAEARLRTQRLSLPITAECCIEWTPEKQLQILPLRVRMTAFVMMMTAVAMVWLAR
jgi:hypothetical protein